MDNARQSYWLSSATGWGALLIWWGILELFPDLPEGTGALGVGAILLGLAMARSLSGLPTKASTIIVGILALAWGALELLNSTLRLAFELPVFAILLIVLGAIFVARELLQTRSI
jgi:hypothetical protein